jgi:hypothetical protein
MAIACSQTAVRHSAASRTSASLKHDFGDAFDVAISGNGCCGLDAAAGD